MMFISIRSILTYIGPLLRDSLVAPISSICIGYFRAFSFPRRLVILFLALQSTWMLTQRLIERDMLYSRRLVKRANSSSVAKVGASSRHMSCVLNSAGPLNTFHGTNVYQQYHSRSLWRRLRAYINRWINTNVQMWRIFFLKWANVFDLNTNSPMRTVHQFDFLLLL
jgi:hypothetical protein